MLIIVKKIKKYFLKIIIYKFIISRRNNANYLRIYKFEIKEL